MRSQAEIRNTLLENGRNIFQEYKQQRNVFTVLAQEIEFQVIYLNI